MVQFSMHFIGFLFRHLFIAFFSCFSYSFSFSTFSFLILYHSECFFQYHSYFLYDSHHLFLDYVWHLNVGYGRINASYRRIFLLSLSLSIYSIASIACLKSESSAMLSTVSLFFSPNFHFIPLIVRLIPNKNLKSARFFFWILCLYAFYFFLQLLHLDLLGLASSLNNSAYCFLFYLLKQRWYCFLCVFFAQSPFFARVTFPSKTKYFWGEWPTKLFSKFLNR